MGHAALTARHAATEPLPAVYRELMEYGQRRKSTVKMNIQKEKTYVLTCL